MDLSESPSPTPKPAKPAFCSRRVLFGDFVSGRSASPFKHQGIDLLLEFPDTRARLVEIFFV